MKNRTHVVTTIAVVLTLLTFGACCLAFAQTTNSPAKLTPGMEIPLVHNIDMEKKVEILTKRVDELENAARRLERQLDGIKQRNNK